MLIYYRLGRRELEWVGIFICVIQFIHMSFFETWLIHMPRRAIGATGVWQHVPKSRATRTHKLCRNCECVTGERNWSESENVCVWHDLFTSVSLCGTWLIDMHRRGSRATGVWQHVHQSRVTRINKSCYNCTCVCVWWFIHLSLCGTWLIDMHRRGSRATGVWQHAAALCTTPPRGHFLHVRHGSFLFTCAMTQL